MRTHGANRPRSEAGLVDETSYRALLGAAGAGVFEADADGAFTYVNDRYCELVGRTREDLIGHFTILDITHPEDVRRNRQQLQEARASGSPFSIEKRYVRPDESIVWVSSFASWASDSGGGGHWLAGAIDITERKSAEQAIRASDERKSFLLRLGDRLRSSMDPVEVMDTAAHMLGEYLQVNRVSYGEVSTEGQVVSGRDYVSGVDSLPHYFHLGEYAPVVLEHFLRDQTSVSCDVFQEPNLTDDLREAWSLVSIRAHVSVPLRIGGKLVAALGVHQSTPRQWTENEITLIEETAERTWAAVEQARAEAALRTSESHLAAIFAQAAVGLCEIGMDGEFNHVNDEMCRLLGRKRHELLQLGISDVTHPDDLQHSFAALSALLENGTPATVDKRYVRPDGSFVYASSTLTRLDEQPYGPRAILVVTVDLSERHKIEQALEDELADNRRLQDISTRLIPAEDISLMFEELVAAAIDITKADKGTLQLLQPKTQKLQILAARGFDDSAARSFASTDRSAATSCAQALRDRQRVLIRDYATDPRVAGTEEARAHLAMGIHAAQSTPLITRSGTILGMISTHWGHPHEPEERQQRLVDILARQAADLLERHQSEEALRLSEERYRELFTRIDSGFGVMEIHFDGGSAAQDFTITEANSAFMRQTGMTEDAFGKRISEVLPDIESHWVQTYGRIAQTGEPERFVQQAHSLGNQWFDVYAFRLGGEGSHKVAALFNDISERVHTEEKLKQADRRKNEFLAMLAHELRNPLAPIRTGMEVLRMSQGQKQTTERMLELMERQMQQMVRLVDDLLDVSRITQGKVQVKRERCNLHSVVENAVEGSRPLIEASGVELQLDLPDEPVIIEADAARLSQVISNLLNNAAKYTESGGKIVVATRVNANDLILRVRDTGTGIPTDMLEDIFETFMQVDNSLARSQGGLGVGLSLVKTLVEMHGGTVRAYSEGLGTGSEFTVCLPRAICRLGVAEAKADLNWHEDLAGYRVLVVDDNADAAQAMGMMLQLMQVDVRVANDGEGGILEAERFRPHLILLDLGMPRMDGYETAARIRAQPWGKSLVIAALTGWGQAEDRRRSEKAGFDHHLVKPVDHSLLESLLRRLAAETLPSER